MEQSVLSSEQRQWVETIIDLTRLTYQEKLSWEKQTYAPLNEAAATAAFEAEPPSRYSSVYDNMQFVLIVAPRNPAFTQFLQAQTGRELSDATVTFEALDLSGKPLVSVTGLTISQRLADAVAPRAVEMSAALSRK